MRSRRLSLLPTLLLALLLLVGCGNTSRPNQGGSDQNNNDTAPGQERLGTPGTEGAPGQDRKGTPGTEGAPGQDIDATPAMTDTMTTPEVVGSPSP
ncbi:MAG: hypothetical protein H0T73_06590 [Ardenticatenales bacterium]|nr:hypothetical protein [Ardenticatenales bacterium]